MNLRSCDTMVALPPAARSGLVRATAALVPDVRVNDPSGDAATAAQSEVAVAALGDHILIAFNDGDGYVHSPFVSAQGYAYSIDGGQSFVDGGSPPGITDWHWDSDPVVAVNEATGEFWYNRIESRNSGASQSDESLGWRDTQKSMSVRLPSCTRPSSPGSP